MVRDEKETVEKVLFSGKDAGLSFEKLDDKMQSWGRKKFGDKYARDLWRNELLDISTLKPDEDELHKFAFEMHCAEVYDMLCEDNVRQAEGLFYTDRFWSIMWQVECRQRQREKLFCYLETLCTGEAARQIQKQGVRKMVCMRAFLFERFGAGQPEVLEARVRRYLDGMPDAKTGLVFPPHCNMVDKLDSLEKEREFLVDMCPRDKREDYEDGKETTLTRMIIRKLPIEYDGAVKTVRDLHRFRAYGKEGDISKITNLEDNTRRNYETEWLPRYLELREELINAYNLMKRRRDEGALQNNKSPGHPTLPLQGFEQPGQQSLTCYGCGHPGHRRGDKKCSAGANDVWAGAPDSFKALVKKRGAQEFANKAPKKFKSGGGGNDKQRNAKPDEGEKGICFNWSRGNGYCKYGDACRFKHEGTKGNSGGGKRKAALIAPKVAKKKGAGQKKQAKAKGVASMVVKDLKEFFKKGEDDPGSDGDVDDKGSEGDDTLFNLVRGSGKKGAKKRKVNFIVTLAGGEAEYVPSRFPSFMMRDTSGKGEYVPKRERSEELSGDEAGTNVDGTTKKKKEGECPRVENGATSGSVGKLRKKHKRRKLPKSGKSEVGKLPGEDGQSVVDWGESTSAAGDRSEPSDQLSDSSKFTPMQESPSLACPTERPSWGYMRDTRDEDRVNADWGIWRQDAERKWRDDKMRGSSPPPKVTRDQPGPNPYGVHRDSKGEECPQGWGSPLMKGPQESSSFRPVQEESSSRSPVRSAKKKRPWNRPRDGKTSKGAMSLESSSSSEGEEEECSFMVKIGTGQKEAKVLFLASDRSKGWEGPFEVSMTLDEMRAFSQRSRSPRASAKPSSATVSEGSDRYTPTSASEGSDSGSDAKDSVFRGGLEQHLTKGRGVGYREVMEAEIKAKALRRAHYRALSDAWTKIAPRYKVGEVVWLYSTEEGVGKWRKACVEKVILPTELQYREGMTEVLYQSCLVPLGGNDSVVTIGKEKDIRPSTWGDVNIYTCLPCSADALHSLDRVGIDTCSALSVSTVAADFLFLDSSSEAKHSVVLRGVGGSSAMIGGRGPMVVLAEDDKGNDIVLIDPAGVYLAESAGQAHFRIFGQQRLKKFGLDLVQNGDGDGRDHLIYKRGATKIPLGEESGILTLATKPLDLDMSERASLDKVVDELLKGDKPDEDDHCMHVTRSSLILNEAYLTKVERDRLMHWRTAHRVSLDPGPKREGLNENCVICDEAKRKTRGYKRNFEFKGLTEGPLRPYERLYMDGYGGQQSMGKMSFEGAIGGFVFACPTGSIKQKLYGTTEQLPAILFQVLQEIEGEGYVCRELYVDTHSVNLSRAVEEVAAMFRVKIIPVSAGTPQEMAYAESAVRVIGEMSRVLMAGAKHLPQTCWGLSDLEAGRLHDFLPQKKTGMSPFEFRHKRKPDLDVFFVHVFGCPCQYAPITGADHKRAKKTEWAWFVGVQWPMVLLLRPEDNKVISVSRHKVHCHEEAYAKYDPATGGSPLENFVVPKMDLDKVRTKEENLQTIQEYKEKFQIPDHVLSVKCLSDFNRHPEFNEAMPRTEPPEKMTKVFEPQHSDRGEEIHKPNLDYDIDAMLEELGDLKRDWLLEGKKSKVEEIRRALTKTIELSKNKATSKNRLKRRKRSKLVQQLPSYEPPTKPPAGTETDIDKIFELEEKLMEVEKEKQSRKTKNFRVLDRVKIKTTRFGKSFARGRPIYTYGTIMKMKGKVCDVQWDDSESVDLMKSHTDFLELAKDGKEGNAVMAMYLLDEPWYDDRVNTIKTILPVLEIGTALAPVNSQEATSLPRDFFEALVREDWRDWVLAVKTEMDSWSMFEAATVVPFGSIERGASIIPLGELFSVKRNGKKKFRQYAMGNLLKEGKDFGETFSSTVSGDGLRWFCSLAVTCARPIKGWDAQTGYLQTVQRIAVYAYLPSHHAFSDLEFEELGPLRLQLMGILKDEGMAGVKKFARTIRKDRRDKPTEVLRLDKSIYGIPDAGQSFSMYMVGLHLKHCGLVQAEMDPCVFYKIVEDRNGSVSGFLIVITWVDDCRYFGTDHLVSEYEANVQKHCKCVLEGESKEFVSIEIKHDVIGRTLELTQSEYWIKAVVRFAEYLPASGPAVRRCPLSPADARLLIEPTEDEMKAAEHLPYASLLGVCQYPSSFTRLEMRYAMSVLSRHRTKWGIVHFKILIKALEYGYSTREMGLKYSCSKHKENWNKLVGFGDASFELPRSQGCRHVMMNNAAISFTSKRHTTTDESTTASEITEAYLLACDVEGFRTLNEEIGLKQNEPTVLWQDNQSAIHIAMNRGSLAKKTRALGVRILSIRNKIEDMKVVPHYLSTEKMIADIGTKALDPKRFCLLRDKLCGYAEWENDLG